MSKIFNAEISADCKPWRAPQLDVPEDVIFDYKLTDPEALSSKAGSLYWCSGHYIV